MGLARVRVGRMIKGIRDKREVKETEEGKWKDAIDVTRNKVWRVGAGRTGSV